LWDPMTGEIRPLPDFTVEEGRMRIGILFEPYRSYFVFFHREAKTRTLEALPKANFPRQTVLTVLDDPWSVSFDPKWGGPEQILFPRLEDWTKNSIEGIKYYSGIAKYRQTIRLPEAVVNGKKTDYLIDLGEVCSLARVHINGKDMGVVWAFPFQVKITEAVLPGENRIEIDVANLWPNRLIGDERFPDDGIEKGRWPDWLLNDQPRSSGRYTFTTAKFFQKDSPLLKSGLIGPVRILTQPKRSEEN
jgi:hypothetical protein